MSTHLTQFGFVFSQNAWHLSLPIAFEGWRYHVTRVGNDLMCRVHRDGRRVYRRGSASKRCVLAVRQRDLIDMSDIDTRRQRVELVGIKDGFQFALPLKAKPQPTTKAEQRASL